MYQEHFLTEEKKKWPRGEWDNEPDKAHWINATTGLDCLIVRQGDHGALCGYVGVPESHPYYGKEGCDEAFFDVEVHGGVTFTNSCREGGRICHPKEGSAHEKVWWIGFDCVHVEDIAPGFAKISNMFSGVGFFPGQSYKDFTYVQQETNNLALQLKSLEAVC